MSLGPTRAECISCISAEICILHQKLVDANRKLKDVEESDLATENKNLQAQVKGLVRHNAVLNKRLEMALAIVEAPSATTDAEQQQTVPQLVDLMGTVPQHGDQAPEQQPMTDQAGPPDAPSQPGVSSAATPPMAPLEDDIQCLARYIFQHASSHWASSFQTRPVFIQDVVGQHKRLEMIPKEHPCAGSEQFCWRKQLRQVICWHGQ